MEQQYHTKEFKFNPNKTKSIRDLGDVDISKLLEIVNLLGEETWRKETEGRENNFSCFHDTQHIIFRFPDDLKDRTVVHSNPIWDVFKSILLPVMSKAVESYGYANGSFKAVMLAKLSAGAIIDKHRDGSSSYYFLHKIHIPIQTNEHVQFYIDPHQYQLKLGRAYEVNNLEYHSVSNNGQNDRIHLIFEYLDEDFDYKSNNTSN